MLPGIKTVDAVANDVVTQNLSINLQDTKKDFDVAFINSKGFGGNNATAYIVSAAKTQEMLKGKYSAELIHTHEEKQQTTRDSAEAYDLSATHGDLAAIYNPATEAIADEDISITETHIDIAGHKIKL